MTNNEAIIELKLLDSGERYDTEYTDFDCFKLAINALEENNRLKSEINNLNEKIKQLNYSHPIKIPFNVGDTMFEIYKIHGRPAVITEVEFTIPFYANNVKEFGKTIFSTREEAEQALKEGEV